MRFVLVPELLLRHIIDAVARQGENQLIVAGGSLSRALEY
jgi:hypothetical protein